MRVGMGAQYLRLFEKSDVLCFDVDSDRASWRQRVDGMRPEANAADGAGGDGASLVMEECEYPSAHMYREPVFVADDGRPLGGEHRLCLGVRGLGGRDAAMLTKGHHGAEGAGFPRAT